MDFLFPLKYDFIQSWIQNCLDLIYLIERSNGKRIKALWKILKFF